MLNPLSTPLLVAVLGNLAHEVIADVCKDHLTDKLNSFLGWLEKLGQRDKVELAYQDAMEQATGVCQPAGFRRKKDGDALRVATKFTCRWRSARPGPRLPDEQPASRTAT
jgi:hypothetical protein